MKRLSRLINPLIALIGIQLLWVLVVGFWIFWFVRSHSRLRTLAERYSPELLQGGIDWFILVEGLLLLVAILAGVYVIFLYWRRQATLYRAQRDFIAQVSHELKSPLASLRLHLETIRRRRLPPQKMEVFLDTMLADTDRLGTMIDNLLAASRLEHRGPKPTQGSIDLSELTVAYFGRHQYALPRAGRMELEVEPGLAARIEPEAIETVYRNLLENAILYSIGPPEIRIHLFRDGKTAHFVLTDRGRGIYPEERENVFRMFHRVRYPGETIRGSGLGLFIVRTIVRLHRGKTWVESAGPGQGTAVHVVLPLAPEPKRQAKS